MLKLLFVRYRLQVPSFASAWHHLMCSGMARAWPSTGRRILSGKAMAWQVVPQVIPSRTTRDRLSSLLGPRSQGLRFSTPAYPISVFRVPVFRLPDFLLSIFRLSILRLVSPLFFLPVAAPAQGKDLAELLPAGAKYCTLQAPPATAGVAVTPGGFVMIHPRNNELNARFTGCKILWIMDGERALKFATLFFKEGRLSVGIAHDPRSSKGSVDGACAFPAGQSLLPQQGRKLSDAGCTDMTAESFYGLWVPTWPRRCMTDTASAVCQQEPD